MPKDEFDPEDPMELVGVVAPEISDAYIEEMAACIVEEYARTGMSDKEIWRLFRNPVYRMTHQIYRETGDAYVEALIANTRKKWGYFKIQFEEAT
jgi:hypothetical protein